jgi:hypothetical protein
MKRQFDEVAALAKRNACPIIAAGDIWDKYNQTPEIVNWAILNLPKMYAIPGQHDLPNHVLADVDKSAYWTLVEAGVLMHLDGPQTLGKGLVVYPFPWNAPITPLVDPDPNNTHLAVIHRYIWRDHKTSYPGADENKKVGGYAEMLAGYDAAVFGDNHIGFTTFINTCEVMNCGTFFIRKSDEVAYRPQVGLLYNDGSISTHYLDVSQDVYLDGAVKKAADLETGRDAKEFLNELRSLGSDSISFREALNRKMENLGTDDAVRRFVLEACQ